MRIQHNIMAMNAYRNYTNNVSAMKKNLERLSSGYKINRAGDDAAGLAISEKMRAQITGLQAAQKNAKDGISLVQTAEGALTEVHDMLNRMVSLATQSANGTYDNTTDRAQLQKEVEQLRAEIDRIADSSNFNGINLLDGSMSSVGTLGTPTDLKITAVADGKQGDNTGNQKGLYTLDLGQLMIAGATAGDTISITLAGQTLCDLTVGTNLDDDGYVKLSAIIDKIKTVTSITITGVSLLVSVDSAGLVTLKGDTDPTKDLQTDFEAKTLNVAVTGGTKNNGEDLGVHIVEAFQAATPSLLAQGSFKLTKDMLVDGAQLTIGNDVYTFRVGKDGTATGGTVIDLSAYEAGDAKILEAAAKALSAVGQSNSCFDISTQKPNSGEIFLTEKEGRVNYKTDWDLQGTTSAADAPWANSETGVGVVRIAAPGRAKGSSLTLQIGDTAKAYNQLKVDIKDMHCASLGLNKVNIGNQAGAQVSIDIIKSAINQVSDVRGTLGATQNRLEHTINNLSVMTENIQDAESTIRDTDIAEEMMAYTKNNILIQSAQAMLAQANQIPQGVLQLLG